MSKKQGAKPLPSKAQQMFDNVIDDLSDLSAQELMELSLDAGVHFTTLYKWKRDAPLRPQLNTFFRIAQSLGYEIIMRRPSVAKVVPIRPGSPKHRQAWATR
jgi:hypothetical protein